MFLHQHPAQVPIINHYISIDSTIIIPYQHPQVKKVLDLIKDETQFLLDMKVRDQLAELPPEQRDVLQIDALLRYIGDLEATGSVEVKSPK